MSKRTRSPGVWAVSLTILMILVSLGSAGCGTADQPSSGSKVAPLATTSSSTAATSGAMQSTTVSASSTTTTAAPTTTTAQATTTTAEVTTTVTETTSTTEEASGTAVYITESGTKYHRDGCRFLSKSKIAISLEEAKAQGYEPCSVCKPPT